MTHTYQVTGMTCGSCEAKVKSALFTLPDVTSVEVSKDNNSATISMSKHISISDLQNAIGAEGKYKITATQYSEVAEQAKSWLATYKPILLIFAYITSVTLLVQLTNHHFIFMQWMQHFMAGFFLTFSFFKMLDLKSFAESYIMYDVVAKRIPAWGYLYAFIELSLGIAYAVNFNPLVTNMVTVVVMSISIIGVLQSVLNKQKIQCACLGAVFNLPMSTVTIIEDALMIAMSAAMLLIM
ncbi:MAG: cation transporter [Chitinophagales bacterium]|jgi:copper chaperone CopZ|nr:cation transporter [Chitinophagales bacterium]